MANKADGRYQVSESEGFEPGSDKEVLKNYQGITTTEDIEALEEQELLRMYDEVEEIFSKEYQFTTDDLCALHEGWLGDIYPFAGKYRSVDLSKDGFPFAASARIAILMQNFEKDYLKKYTPCNYQGMQEIAEALAIVHVEFILIHPFREGNGRLGRLLATLMAIQADLPPLDFSPIDQNENPEGFQRYIRAIHKGVSCDYSLMIEVFREIIEFTQKTA